VRLVPDGSSLNLLAEVPALHWGSPAGEYYPLGGHRLWAAPEIPSVTYLPDHESVIVEPLENGLRLSHEDHYGVHYLRTIEVRLNPTAPKLTLTHTIQNLDVEPFTTAPWAVTMFRLGGRAYLPMTDGAIDGSEFTPNRSLILWPYTDLEDERLFISNTMVKIKAESRPEALKVGLFSNRGWTAIEFTEGWVLIKRFSVSQASDYTDNTANVQCYVRDQFIELETLGEFKRLESGESVSLVEEWELLPGSFRSLGLA
jgi:hypothetical protein